MVWFIATLPRSEQRVEVHALINAQATNAMFFGCVGFENIYFHFKMKASRVKKTMPYYATYTGHIRSEVFETWEECKREIHKTPKYKKFATRAEAEAFQEYGPFGAPEVTPYENVVYTDGACRSNGRAGAIGGIGVYFAPEDPRNVSRRLEGKCTNNIAELTALIEGVKMLPDGETSAVYTDSNYAILCCSTYGDKLLKKGWPEDIPNRTLVKEAYELVKTKRTKVIHVQAHTGATDMHSVGNHNADQLATACLH